MWRPLCPFIMCYQTYLHVSSCVNKIKFSRFIQILWKTSICLRKQMFHCFICVFFFVSSVCFAIIKLRIILIPQSWLTVCFDFIDLKSVSQRINWFYELWIVTMTVSFFAFYMCNTAKNSYFTDSHVQMRNKRRVLMRMNTKYHSINMQTVRNNNAKLNTPDLLYVCSRCCTEQYSIYVTEMSNGPRDTND